MIPNDEIETIKDWLARNERAAEHPQANQFVRALLIEREELLERLRAVGSEWRKARAAGLRDW